MSSVGDCYVVLSPVCASETVIFGRNGIDTNSVNVAQEVLCYDASKALEGMPDGGASPDVSGETYRIIVQKPRPGVWGADFGANDRNVSIGISYDNESNNEGCTLCATDIVRCALAVSTTAEDAVDRIGVLIEAHNADHTKFNLVVCDPKEAWAVSCGGKLWAAERHQNGLHFFPHCGMAVTKNIHKSSSEVGDELQAAGLLNGVGDLNFAECMQAVPKNTSGCFAESVGDNAFSLSSMFETLRLAANPGDARAATVSVLAGKGISCHWFTATPNAKESVFKPFVFSPQAIISPLTKVPPDSEETLLYKLHSKRKETAVEDLKGLEAACVEELDVYFSEHATADQEVDELMKDCVEAEVKFYR